MRAPLVAAALLLLCAHLGACLVRRDAPETPEEATPEATPDFFSRHFQTLSDFFTQELPQKLQAEQLRSQAEQYLDRANKQLAPLAQELKSNVLGLFSSLLDLGKSEGQP
ncbi:apolipoprotein A-II-like [Empidonax traillii]|uniref:apolipoprotein A-II-like n=1 Tax=Empidonax traillii TaxID=164674 RepID=UPI000FFCEAD0|nr:apolipoprotein A-II-like [Empidonax traillii]